jgi:hypothetical protein
MNPGWKTALLLKSPAPYGFLVAALAFTVLLNGCAGYNLGPSNGTAARGKSIQVNPFANQTLEPRLSDALTSQLRKQLQQDGTFKLSTSDGSDIVVTGVITSYQRQELSFLPSDNLTVQDYRVSMTAKVTARDRISGKVLLDQPITGFTIIRVGNDLASTERQALPLLAADVAKTVTSKLVDGSW